MEIKEGLANEHLVLSLEGRLDANTSASLQEKLLAELDKRPKSIVVLDLGSLNYLSSAGLRVLLVAAKTGKKINTEVRLAALRPHVEEVFTLSGFDALFSFFPTIDEAAKGP
ncbi:STAS domain-containing protein [bacterium]|nr:STAS domain-containing protein [bacterium]